MRVLRFVGRGVVCCVLFVVLGVVSAFGPSSAFAANSFEVDVIDKLNTAQMWLGWNNAHAKSAQENAIGGRSNAWEAYIQAEAARKAAETGRDNAKRAEENAWTALLNAKAAAADSARGATQATKASENSWTGLLTTEAVNTQTIANGKALANLLPKVEAAKSAADAVGNLVTALKGTEIKKLQTDVTALSKNVNSVKSTVGAINTNVAGLKTKVDELVSSVAALKTQIAGIKPGVQLAEIQPQFNALNQEVGKVQAAIAALPAGADTSVVEGQVTRLSGAVETVRKLVAGLKPVTASELQSKVSSLESKMTELQAAQAAQLAEVSRQLRALSEASGSGSAWSSGDVVGIVDKVSGIMRIIDRVLGNQCDSSTTLTLWNPGATQKACGPSRSDLRDGVKDVTSRLDQIKKEILSGFGKVVAGQVEAGKSVVEGVRGEVDRLVERAADIASQVGSVVRAVNGAADSLGAKIAGLATGPSGVLPVAAPVMPRLDAWNGQARCLQSAVSGGGAAGCPSLEVSLGPAGSIDVLGPACAVVPADKFTLVRSLLSAVLIVGACLAAFRAIMSGLSFQVDTHV